MVIAIHLQYDIIICDTSISSYCFTSYIVSSFLWSCRTFALSSCFLLEIYFEICTLSISICCSN
uniref:Uncharacterized protein n=1 Tax=Rhizophora mucronata TaxID=61149 RepID=A0A2P2PFX9_RHIMU